MLYIFNHKVLRLLSLIDFQVSCPESNPEKNVAKVVDSGVLIEEEEVETGTVSLQLSMYHDNLSDSFDIHRRKIHSRPLLVMTLEIISETYSDFLLPKIDFCL